MSALWTAQEAAIATGSASRGAWSAKGVSIDTRTLETGDLFVALKGEMRDGHEFVSAALAKSASAALVSRVPEGVAQDAPLLIVRDTQEGLEALGRAARARTKARIVAVTGSAGKTTTKEMLRLMLGSVGKVAASAASYNNQWGVPLSLARMDRATEFGVFEIGMNHEGEIRALARQVRPHVALITTVAPAHLEYFETVEAIADAKAEIFDGLEPGGTVILPFDNPHFPRLMRRAEEAGIADIRSFSVAEGADARVLNASPSGAGQIVVAEIGGRKIEFAIAAAGAHIASNAVAALAAVHALGVDPTQAAMALKNFAPLKGRGARITHAGIEIIDESYNANPASMSAALALLGDAQLHGSARRIAVLGDMRELGAESAALHRALEHVISVNKIDLVFLCGREMRALWNALPPQRRGAYAENSASLAPEFLAQVRPGDAVLIKGSFASRMSVIVDALKAAEAAKQSA